MNKTEKIGEIKTGKYFAWGDIIIFVGAVLLTALFTVFAFLQPKEEAESFSVYYNGECIFTASLQENRQYLFSVEDGEASVCIYSEGMEYGEDYNLIEVSNGKVRVLHADCADHTCIYQGPTDWGEILCLPHGLKIVAEGEGLETDI